jgi:hypothetical protein
MVPPGLRVAVSTELTPVRVHGHGEHGGGGTPPPNTSYARQEARYTPVDTGHYRKSSSGVPSTMRTLIAFVLSELQHYNNIIIMYTGVRFRGGFGFSVRNLLGKKKIEHSVCRVIHDVPANQTRTARTTKRMITRGMGIVERTTGP